MIRIGLALSVLAAVISLESGCASGEVRVAPKTRQTVVLETTSKRIAITSKVAEELTLELPAPAEPGHEWRLVFHDPRMLWQTSEIVVGAGKASVSFVTQRTVQRTFLRFLLVPTESTREAEPLDIIEVVVSIQS